VEYADFDLKTALRTFELVNERDTDLFAAVEPIELNPHLVEWLDEFASVALGINTDKARSTYIITPILAEAKRRAGTPVNVLPGVAFDVDRARGLSGFCDYLITRSSKIFYIQAPIVAVVEAKKEDLIAGLGQCVAEMVAIRLFNEREQSPTPIVHGCVTSGNLWRFLKLEGSTLTIDRPEYCLPELPKILGILVHMIRGGSSTHPGVSLARSVQKPG
jgi:hypothetical protein